MDRCLLIRAENGTTGSAGSPAENAFVSVNTVHIFDDDTLWVVDQAAPGFGSVLPGAQKVVQIDTQANKVSRVFRSDADILPQGPGLNDVRKVVKPPTSPIAAWAALSCWIWSVAAR